MTARNFLLFSILLLFSSSAFAQQDGAEASKAKQERELKLLEEILADARTLRLPENRAYVLARVGSALWLTDEKAARKLFQESFADLLAAQTEAQNEKLSSRQHLQGLIHGQAPRMEIITLIGSRDALLALEYLEKSRPAAIAEAMQNPRDDDYSTSRQYARSEIVYEQRLLAQATEQNPEFLIRKIRESIKRGISYETLNMLNKIHAKDAETAARLADEALESMLKLDFSKYSQASDSAAYFIAQVGGSRAAADEKALKISDAVLRRVILKMTDDWLNPKNSQSYNYWNCLPIVERLFPERAASLKKRIETNKYKNQTEEAQRYIKLMDGDTPPEEMLAQADKFQSSYRNELYRAAATKYVNKGNFAEAERVVQSNLSDEQSQYYLAQFYANASYQLAGQGKFDQAADFVNRIEDEYQRINALVNLANTAYARDPKENLKIAEGLLGQARALLPETLETQNALQAASTLATAYVQYDTNESFRVMESMLPGMNELIQAHFVLMKFKITGGMRQNEVQIIGGSSFSVFNLENTLRALKAKDFERTLQFADGFSRLETRIWLRLQLIDDNAKYVDLSIKGRRSIYF